MSYSQEDKGIPLPPQSLDTEVSVLGSVLKDSSCLHELLPILKKGVFYAPKHQKIWTAIVNLTRANEPVDIITVANELNRGSPLKGDGGQTALDSIGGRVYLVEMAETVGSILNVVEHANIIIDKWKYRSLINTCNEITHGAYAQIQPVQELMNAANREISKIFSEGTTRSAANAGEAIGQVMEDLDRIAKHEIVRQIPFGFNQLDDICSNRKGELIIIGGRPGMGKTSFMLNCAFIQASKGSKVGFYSAETRLDELTLRLLCQVGKVNSRLATRGDLSDQDWTRLIKARKEVEDANIMIDDTPQIDIDALVSKSHGLVGEHGVEIIYIDYLQYLTSSQRFSDHRFKVGYFAKRLKGLAQDLEIPVVVASQVSRDCDSRGRTWRDKRPRMSDLRESGIIEEVSDMIIFLFRPILHIKKESNDFDKWRDVCLVDVAKQRNGPTGECELSFNPRFTRFEDLKGKEDTLPF